MRNLPQFANGSGWRNAFVATLTIGLFLMFWIPTRVAPPIASSESFLFGFNNHVCQFLLILLIVALAVIAKLGELTLPDAVRFSSPGNGGLTPRLLAVCLVVAVVLCAGVFWLAGPLGGIGDGAYFIDRIRLMERHQAPFRDFEFVYGSAPLYVSLFLGRLLHIQPDSGYHIIWFVETLTGIVLLWFFIRWTDLPAGGKRTVFLLYIVIALLFIPGDTLNYCMLRYSLPVFGLTALCRLDRDNRAFTRAQVIAFGLCITAILLNISPEEGLAYGVTLCIVLPVRRYYARQPIVLDTAIFAAALAALCIDRAHAGTFATMKRFGAGAFNLPVYPGPHILATIAAILFMVCYLASGRLSDRARSNVTPLVLYGLAMIPGAFGRCDPTHMFGYLMAILVCTMLLCWQWPGAWRIATWGFALLFIIVPTLLMQAITPPTFSKALLNHVYQGGMPNGRIPILIDHLAVKLAIRTMGEQRGMSKITALRNSSAAAAVDPRRIFPGASPIVSVPFEYMPNKLSNYQAPWIDEGRFMGTLNVLAPSEVQEKIAELDRHPEEDLVVSTEGLGGCGVSSGDRQEIRVLLELPWVPKPRNVSPLLVPLCDYIHGHYSFVYPPSPATFGYGLMRREPTAP